MIVIETFGRGRAPGASREHGRREKYDPMPPEKSLCDVEDLLAERGIMVSYETVWRWVNHFGPMIAADLRKRRETDANGEAPRGRFFWLPHELRPYQGWPTVR